MIKLLYIVLGFYILIKFINPLMDNIEHLKSQNILIKHRIDINKKLFKDKDRIDFLFKKALKNKKELDNILFASNYSQTQVFTSLQKNIKSFDQKHIIKRLNWGNVYIKNGVKFFPITVYLEALPKDFGDFIEKICNSNKLLFVNYLKINAINKRVPVKYQIKLIAFQKADKIEKNKNQ